MPSNNEALVLATEQSTENIRAKPPRVRSSAYPSYDILFCIEFTKKFHQSFGNVTYILREEIAKVLGISVSHIQTQLSSSSQYELVDMKVKVGYKPSQNFLKVYKPISDDEMREALIDCLVAPELYKKLLMQYKGTVVPSVAALSTILFRNHNIAEAASKSAAEIFIKNLNDLNLLDDDNVLTLDREISEDDIQREELQEHKAPKPVKVVFGNKQIQVRDRDKIFSQHPVSFPSNAKISVESLSIPIPLKSGGIATLVIPKGFTGEDLDKITRFIEALRE